MKKKKSRLLVRLLQNKGVKDLVERTTSIHLVDQNKIGDTFRDQKKKKSRSIA